MTSKDYNTNSAENPSQIAILEVIANPYRGPRVGGFFYNVIFRWGLLEEPTDVGDGKYYNLKFKSNLPKDHPVRIDMTKGLMKKLSEESMHSSFMIEKKRF